MSEAVHIIAEAGTNHGGRRPVAEQLIHVAQDAGADSVKFQVIYPEGLYLPATWEGGKLEDNAVFAIRRAAMMADDDYRALNTYAQSKGLPMSASVFDVRGLDLLDELDAPYIKIASCDLNNGPFLKAAAERGRRMILATGMASLGEVEQAVADVTSTGNTDLVLLHCVSVYPCPTARMNLGFLTTLKQAFGFPVGLSDHTENSLAAAMAVALRATWIEKHFTLDRASEGFDHAYAMEPDMLTAFIQDVRDAEAALRRPQQKVGDTEAGVKQRARRALYAARDLPPGTEVTDHDVLIVRPEGPLRPNQLPQVLGKSTRRTIRQFEPLDLAAF